MKKLIFAVMILCLGISHAAAQKSDPLADAIMFNNTAAAENYLKNAGSDYIIRKMGDNFCLAIEMNNPEMVELMLAYAKLEGMSGKDIDNLYRNKEDGNTPLMIAIIHEAAMRINRGATGAEKILKDTIKIVDMLIDYGCNINEPDNAGFTIKEKIINKIQVNGAYNVDVDQLLHDIFRDRKAK